MQGIMLAASDPRRAAHAVTTLQTLRIRYDVHHASLSSCAKAEVRRKFRRNVGYSKGIVGSRHFTPLSTLPVVTLILLFIVAHSGTAVNGLRSSNTVESTSSSLAHRRAPQFHSTDGIVPSTSRRHLDESEKIGTDDSDEQDDDIITDDTAPEDGDKDTDENELPTESEGEGKVTSNATNVDAPPSNATVGTDADSKNSVNNSPKQPASETRTKSLQAGTAGTTPTLNDNQLNSSVVAPMTAAVVTLAPIAARTASPVEALRPVPTVAPRSVRIPSSPAPRISPTAPPSKTASNEDEIHNRDTGRPLPDTPPATLSFEVLAALLGIVAMIFTAWQMSDNPDGLFASMCRLIITCLQLVSRIVTSPCRKCLPCCFSYHAGNGYHEPYGHMRVSTMDYGYKDPALELS